MGNQKENCLAPVSRYAAARKRAAAEMVERQTLDDLPVLPPSTPPAKKKRVALGELRINAMSTPDEGGCIQEKPRPKPMRASKISTRHRKQEKKAAVVHCHGSEDASTTPADVGSIPDIDTGFNDPQMCAHYATDIHQYLRSMEAQSERRPLANYIEKIQTDVSPNMRRILVDWLVEVADEYKLTSDTLYLSVSYIDLFLSRKPINRKKLQLLGVTCMLIASKYEEISPPHIDDFCDITDDSYPKGEVVRMETDVLKVLQFEMGNPTAKTFLRRYTRAGQDDCNAPSMQLEFLACYLAELSLLDYDCVRFLPSLVAASVVFLARHIINPKAHPWTPSLSHYTGYRPSDLKICVGAIHGLLLSKKVPDPSAIEDRYKQHRFKCVSALPFPSDIPQDYFEETSYTIHY